MGGRVVQVFESVMVVGMASVNASAQAFEIVKKACAIVKDKQAWMVVMHALT